MRTVDSVRRAARSLGNAKARTILTSLAIGVGAFTLTMALAGGTGARQYITKLIESNVDPQSIYVAKDKSLMNQSDPRSGLREYDEDSVEYSGMSFKSLTEDDISKLQNTPGVDSVLPSYLINAQYITVQDIDKKYSADITTYDPTVRAEIAAGNLPPKGEQIGIDEVVIPESYAQSLGKKPAELIGKTMTLRIVKTNKTPTDEEIQTAFMTGGMPAVEDLYASETKDVQLRLRAISAKSATSFSASNGLFISPDQAEQITNWVTEGTDQYKKYITAIVMAKADANPDEVKKSIESKEIYAMTAKELQGMIFTIVNLLQGIVLVFGMLALFASVFGIINTQYISVLERTREIGLMKALGMRGRHVSRLFQYEAAWIGFLGGVIGAVLAWGVGTALNPWISETIGLGDQYLLVFEPLPIIGLIVVLILIAMIAGWFPARKAAKLDPIEALRTE